MCTKLEEPSQSVSWSEVMEGETGETHEAVEQKKLTSSYSHIYIGIVIHMKHLNDNPSYFTFTHNCWLARCCRHPLGATKCDGAEFDNLLVDGQPNPPSDLQLFPSSYNSLSSLYLSTIYLQNTRHHLLVLRLHLVVAPPLHPTC